MITWMIMCTTATHVACRETRSACQRRSGDRADHTDSKSGCTVRKGGQYNRVKTPKVGLSTDRGRRGRYRGRHGRYR
eukprot:3064759-Pyramimonas_sp.AAC.2